MIRSLSEYIVVAVLLLGSVLMFFTSARVAAARAENRSHDNSAFWASCAVILLVFVLVKILNLSAFVGVWLRELTKAFGTYDGRRPIQLVALGAITLMLVLVIAALAASPGLARRHSGLILSILLLGAFGAARFISLHALDAAVGKIFWLKWIAEAALSSFCVISAARALRRLAPDRHRDGGI